MWALQVACSLPCGPGLPCPGTACFSCCWHLAKPLVSTSGPRGQERPPHPPPIRLAPGYSSSRPGTSPGTQQYAVVTSGQLGLEFLLCSSNPSDTLHRDTFSCEGHELMLEDPSSRPEQAVNGRFSSLFLEVCPCN